MVNTEEISIYDAKDDECLVIQFDKETGNIISVLIACEAMKDFLPIDLKSELSEVKRTIQFAETKISQFYENESYAKDIEEGRAI